MTNKKTRQYTDEFKREIAELVLRNSKSQAQISRETGISNQNISRWVKEYRGTEREDESGRAPSWEEYQAMQAELRRAREERDILKKALNIFSRNG